MSLPRLLKRPKDGMSTWKPQQTRIQCLHRCFWKGLWIVRLLENHNRQELSVFAEASEKAYRWYVYLKTTTDKSSVSSPMLMKRPMDCTSTWKPQQTRAQCLRRSFWKGLWMVLLLENHNRQELSVFADASEKAYGWYFYLKTTTDKSSVSSPMLLERPMDCASTWKPQQTRAQCLCRGFWKVLWMVLLLENHNRQELSVFADASEKAYWWYVYLKTTTDKKLSVFADASEKAYGWCVFLKTTTDKSSVNSPKLLKRPMDGASTWKSQQTRAQCLHRCFWKGLWMVRLLENHKRQELSVFGDVSEKAYRWCVYLKTTTDKSSVSSPMLLEKPMDGASTWKPQQTRAQCLLRCFLKSLWIVRLLENHNRQEISVFAEASEKAYRWYVCLKTTTDKSSVSSPRLLKRPMNGTSTWKPQQTRAQCLRRCSWKGLWMVLLLENHNRQELSVFTDASWKAYGLCVYIKITTDKSSVSFPRLLKRPIYGMSIWNPQQTRAQCLHRCFWKGLWIVLLLENHNRQELSVFTDASEKAYGWCVYLKTTKDKSSVSSAMFLKRPIDGASTWKPQQTRAQCLRRSFWKGLWMVCLLENHKRQELSVFAEASEKAYGWCVYLKITTDKSSVSSPMLLKRPMDGASTWKPQKTRAQCLRRCFWKGL